MHRGIVWRCVALWPSWRAKYNGVSSHSETRIVQLTAVNRRLAVCMYHLVCTFIDANATVQILCGFSIQGNVVSFVSFWLFVVSHPGDVEASRCVAVHLCQMFCPHKTGDEALKDFLFKGPVTGGWPLQQLAAPRLKQSRYLPIGTLGTSYGTYLHQWVFHAHLSPKGESTSRVIRRYRRTDVQTYP